VPQRLRAFYEWTRDRGDGGLFRRDKGLAFAAVPTCEKFRPSKRLLVRSSGISLTGRWRRFEDRMVRHLPGYRTWWVIIC
jgi:hypothetical protein